MKKMTILLLIIAAVFSLNGCVTIGSIIRAANDEAVPMESSTAEVAPEKSMLTQEPTIVQDDFAVYLADSLVEDAVRDYLDKPEGDIMNSEIEDITILSFVGGNYSVNEYAEWGENPGIGILSVDDFKKFPNLMGLEISNQRFSMQENLQKLSKLEGLTTLQLAGVGISDVTPLANLTNLTELGLDCNSISDLSPLSALHNLEVLCLRENNISDLSPLADLQNLQTLFLDGNPVADWKPVEHVGTVEGKADSDVEEKAESDVLEMGDYPINQDLIGYLNMTLDDVAQANGGTLPEPAFEEDGLYYYQAAGLYDTFLAFEDPSAYEMNSQNKLQKIIASTVELFYKNAVSVDWLREAFGSSLVVTGGEETVDVNAEINGIVFDFYAESVDDDMITNLIIYQR